jgi:hypothetical protein
MILAEFGTGQVFWSLMWLFLFGLWMFLLIQVFGDIFRSSDLSGWGKAFWTIFVIVLPYLGIFVYLITRGSAMQERRIEAASGYGMPIGVYGSEYSAGGGTASELTRLVDLRDRGLISDGEFTQAKAKALA